MSHDTDAVFRPPSHGRHARRHLEEQQLEHGKRGMTVHVGVSSEAWMTSLSLAAQIRLRQVLNTKVARLCPHVCV